MLATVMDECLAFTVSWFLI